MTGNLKYCISLLQDNEERVRKNAEEILVKLCGNILKNPQESRYRKIKLSNEVVSTKLLAASGAIECLFEAGFLEMEDGFLLPTNASLAGVTELHKLLTNQSPQRRPDIDVQPSTSTGTSTAAANKPLTCTRKPYVESEFKGYTFLKHLEGHFRGVLRYEDKSLQDKVKTVVPIDLIKVAATKKLRTIQSEMKMKKKDYDVVFEDVLLSELLSWFKSKFFKWVDTLQCDMCTGDCYNDKSVESPNPQISRIEIHRCKICGYENEFPRYTDPESLLYTRRGRCGEWANCFTLICRVVGFDARFVYDETDHVWTEVWSDAHKKWVHADACENAMDTPLVYEKGWGKKLSYVIAISRDEMQDVTWRYTRDYKEVMKRRKRCPERTLSAFIHKMNVQRQNSVGYSTARKNYVLKRSALELAEMLPAPPGATKPSEELEKEAEYVGRTSGSLAWRTTRDELGKAPPRHQWLIPKGVMNYELRYFVLSDSYEVRDAATNATLSTKQKWVDGIESVSGGIFRKEESDWRMVYLARSVPAEPGTITWTFAVPDDANACIDTVMLQATIKTYKSATVIWDIQGVFPSENTEKEETKVVSTVFPENYVTSDLKGAIKVRITATLSGGDGDIAWQQAQIFRQSMNANKQEPSMVIKVNLTNRF